LLHRNNDVGFGSWRWAFLSNRSKRKVHNANAMPPIPARYFDRSGNDFAEWRMAIMVPVLCASCARAAQILVLKPGHSQSRL
jgi:hypothetical protein